MRDRRGIALVAALWALLLLASLGTAVALTARRHLWMVGTQDRRAAARWSAEAGIAEAETRLDSVLVELITRTPANIGAASLGGEEDPGMRELRARARAALETFNSLDSLVARGGDRRLPNGAEYALRVHDVSTRLNLNAADEPELRNFFRQWILDERELAIFVESLLDWRDEDDLARANGAEQAFYARRDERVRNGLLLSIRELLRVRGMTPEILERVEPFLVVLPSRDLRINVNAAPVPVLAAIPGFSREMATALVFRRRAQGPFLSAAEITADQTLRGLFDAGTGARAINVIATHPEVLEVWSAGRASEGESTHTIRTLYAVEGAALRRLEREEADQ
ncbi:MAG TPA: type II secretion system protein GspK [Longimicrobium sp.]